MCRRTSVGTVTAASVPPPGMRTCVRYMIVCILLPRFELAVAAGGREALAAGPLALAPEIGREPLVGETSAAAEAYGVRAGLRLGEALARCPTLRLVAPDPAGVADAWEHVVGALEGIGAAVESDRPGAAWFEEQGLRRLHGGSVEGVITAARRALAAARVGNQGGGSPPAAANASSAPVVGLRAGAAAPALSGGAGAAAAAGRDATPFAPPASGVVAPLSTGAASSGAGRVGAAPSRFAALAAAHRARARRAEIAPESPKSLAAYLAPLPVSLLSARPEVAALPEALERFGIATLGELAALSRAQLADRFGAAGPTRARPRPREGLAAAATGAVRASRGGARVARVGLRPAAGTGARDADRPRARPQRAARAGRCAPSCSRPSWSAAGRGGRR